MHKTIGKFAAILTLALVPTFILIALACTTFCAEAKQGDVPLKVGFLAVGPVTDWGWNYEHNQGRLFLEKQGIPTTMAERIPESAEAERVLEKMIAQGNKLIFATSYGYLEPVLKVALRHPDVTFMQVNRFQTAKNVGTYLQLQYQPMYLAGIVAGRMTKSNKLGFIAAHPVPPLLQTINAFTLGARSVNPEVKTQVVWTNSWSDQVLEAEAVRGLSENGADVIAHAQDNQTTILKTCEDLNMYSVGFYADAHELAPRGWLTGACLDWGPFYLKMVNSVKNHSWMPGTFMPGIESGCARLSTFGKAVPTAVREEIASKQQLLKSGKVVVFEGPMKDRDGKERIPSGHNLDIKELAEMNWFVPGVQGTLPKK